MLSRRPLKPAWDIFRATQIPSTQSRAFQTSPYPPRASRLSRRYLPSRVPRRIGMPGPAGGGFRLTFGDLAMHTSFPECGQGEYTQFAEECLAPCATTIVLSDTTGRVTVTCGRFRPEARRPERVQFFDWPAGCRDGYNPGMMTEHAEPGELLQRLRDNVAQVFLGRADVIDHLIVGLIAGGHVLIEDVPGVGKTILARALAKSVQSTFSRIQLTPDLLPSDVIGVSIFNERTREFEFKRGPLFASIVLTDEINRATPRTQSALLEAMNEAQVTVDGQTMSLGRPFMVIATQNPFEFEGTYGLPENQMDRFALRISIGYPSAEQEARIILEQPARRAIEEIGAVMSADQVIALQDAADAVKVSEAVMDYTLRFVQATRGHRHLDLGVSPRGAQALVRAAQAMALLDGREYVLPDDIKALAGPVCAHRVLSKSYLDDSQSNSTSHIISQMIEETTVPV